MPKSNRKTNPEIPKTLPARLRCAIYTRKSTEEGLEQEFNSLDAQREAAEAFIQSQRREGWSALPELYDDGGFTGANMDRPALTRLLHAVEAGELDCVVVYKVDRLSRSLLDFTRMLSACPAKRRFQEPRRDRLTRHLLLTQLLHSFGDRPARHACRPRNQRNASISNSRALRSRHQAPHPLVQKGRQRMKSQPNALVTHCPRV